MTRFLFTADGKLREQASGSEPRVLSHIEDGPGGMGARLVSGGDLYEIVPLAQLEAPTALRVREVGVSLHGRPWAHEGWAFSLPDGRRVEATITPTDEISSNGDGKAAQAAAGAGRVSGSFVVVLEAVASLEPLALAEVLALGSWLIARWHVAPTLDHVLASGAAGTGLASSSAKPAPAGIRAQTAN